MNIPAYTSPNLHIGRTFDIEKATAGRNIFPSSIQPKEINVNRFSFKYLFVKNSKDVNYLLDISGELSLKIKANLLKVEGAGQYVNKSETEEGKTTLMAVMKCTTVTETMEDEVKPTDNTAGLGTHYVRSVTYGAELVTKLSFRTSSEDKEKNIKGRAEGKLSDGLQAVNAGLKADLQKLAKDFNSDSDLQVDYYSTGLPNKLPTTIDDLITLIETFPSRMKDINGGKGIPMTFELLPVTNIIPTARTLLHDRVKAYELDEMESCFDDVRRALNLANEYLEHTKGQHGDVKSFITATKNVEKVFRKAISSLGGSKEKKQVEESQTAYEAAFDGFCSDNKFVQQWKEIVAKKKPICKIKLPQGRQLTLILLGKTGNGKSKTGNSILGRREFEPSASAQSVTKTCRWAQRPDERKINVINTPGVLDTGAVSLMGEGMNTLAYLIQNKKRQAEILEEVARIFAMTPDGCDCFILVAKYGCRFTQDDAQALKMLEKLLGKDAYKNIILVLTYGDQLELQAEENEENVDDTLKKWLKTLPNWVNEFIISIEGRIFPFNNLLCPDKHPEEYKQQLSCFITLVDKMTAGREPFIHPLTNTSKAVLEQHIEEALEQSGVSRELKSIQIEKEELEEQIQTMEHLEENVRAAEEMKIQNKKLEYYTRKQGEHEKEIAREQEEIREQQLKDKAELEKEIEKVSEIKKALERKRSKLMVTIAAEHTGEHPALVATTTGAVKVATAPFLAIGAIMSKYPTTSSTGKDGNLQTDASKAVLEREIEEALENLLEKERKMKQLKEENARKEKKLEELEERKKRSENFRKLQEEYEKEMARKQKEIGIFLQKQGKAIRERLKIVRARKKVVEKKNRVK